MRLIVAGTRTININPGTILGLMDFYKLDLCSTEGHEIVSGGCPTGPDAAAKLLPKYITASYKEFPAQWHLHGKAAGPIRNKQMAEYADALLLIWDGKSKGSVNMKKEMERLNKPIYEVIFKA